MKCPRCQAENDAGARFCEDCGARLEAACPSCGTPVTPGKKFCRSCGAALTPEPAGRFARPDSYTPKHLAEKILTSRSALEGERKQVTVLFADLKGSMELLADRDPEEARKLLDPVLERMMEAVHHYEGTVNQVMGDGIMALFGAPIGHEDHAVRACYAALRMQRRVNLYADEVQQQGGTPVQIRVGVNSGEVVVRAIGSDLHMDYTAVGQTTHLAARMEQMAKPGAALVTGGTLKLAEGYVQVRPLGAVPVKGLEIPTPVYELTGIVPARSRLQASTARGLTRFVGRDRELEQLAQALERAAAGHGQAVAVVGEAGVGKSRLAWEFTRSHRIHGWLVLESGSVSYGRATPYLPVIELLKAYFRIQERDEPREIRERVAGKLLMLDRALEPLLTPLLALLDVPVEDAAWAALDPPQRRQRTLDAIKRLLLRESQVQPLLLLFEDLHWIDAETQALLDGLMESLPSARILLLVNYRPEYQHIWGGKTYYLQLRIDPLPRESADTLLTALLGEDHTLVPLKRVLIARTEGNPFFLEESVRTLVETEVLVGERGAYRVTKAPDAWQIPATAQAILAARVDRLAPEDKRLLQAAAIIGKDVPFALLQAIADLPEEDLRRGLSHLQAAEFLYETSLFPDLEYTFKHALTHEVTYGGLLQDRRRSLHGEIVETIERLYPDRLTEHIERLAHHAVRAEKRGKAVEYLLKAGDKAARAFANAEAIARYEQARDLVTRDEPNRRAEVLQKLATIHELLGHYGESLQLFGVALELVEASGDADATARLETRIGRVRYSMADHEGAIACFQSALARTQHPARRAVCHQSLGDVHFTGGSLAAAIECYTTALAISEQAGNQAGMAAACTFLSNAHGRAGNLPEAIHYGRRALEFGERLNDERRIAWACIMLAQAHFEAGDLAEARNAMERARTLFERVGDFRGLVAWVQGWVGAHLKLSDGDLAGALDLQKICVRMGQESGGFQHEVSAVLARAAETLKRLGRIGEAFDHCQQSLALSLRASNKLESGYGYMVLAELHALKQGPDWEAAGNCLDASLKAFREAGAQIDIGRAHLAAARISRLHQDGEAAELAERARRIFAERGARLLLKEAEALLADAGE